MAHLRILIAFVLLPALLACDGSNQHQAFGTLEWDRIELVATASEPIVAVHEREGQQLTAGEPILQLDSRKHRAELARLVAVRDQAEARLAELVEGPRQEEIAEARAKVERAKSLLWESEVTWQRQQSLVAQNLTSQSNADRAKTAHDAARADLTAIREVLGKLLAGTRVEAVDQAEAKLEQAKAAVERYQVIVDELTVLASRDGRLDVLPYKLGERPPVGAVLAVVLAGPAPFARVYISETDRTRIGVGQELTIHADGLAAPLSGSVRRISADAVFTPYFALSERDRGRLAYVAEVILPEGQGSDLPAGIPVQVDMPGTE